MPVRTPQIPEEALAAFHAGLDSFLNPDDPIRSQLGGAELIGLPMYTIGLDEVLRGEQPYQVVPAGWRILASGPEGELIISADVDRRQERTVLVSVSTDPSAGRLLTSLRETYERAQLIEDEWDLSFLRIPGVLVDAFALASQGGSPDYLVPVRAPDRTFEPLRRYTVEDFFERIAGRPSLDGRIMPSLADRFLEFDRLRPRRPR